MHENIEEVEEYYTKHLMGEAEFSHKEARMIVSDILDAFTDNVPKYNKELEEENRVLKDQLEAFVDMNRQAGHVLLDMVGIYEKDKALKELRGK